MRGFYIACIVIVLMGAALLVAVILIGVYTNVTGEIPIPIGSGVTYATIDDIPYA